MSSDQDKRPSLVPLGVFGSRPSAPPPPPAPAVPAEAAAVPPPAPVPVAPQPATGTPPVAAAASPVPAAPEPAPAEPRGSQPPADRPSFPRTLVGVPSLSPEVARARRGEFVAPPKWQGAAAYAGGAPALRTGSGAPLPPGAQPPPPAPSTALSASAPPPAVPPAPFPLAKDAPVLGRVNLRQAAVPVPVGTAPAVPAPAPQAARPQRADDTEEELDLGDVLDEVPAVDARPARLAEPGPREPVASAAASRARPTEAVDEPQPEAVPVTRSSIPPVIVPQFARKDPSEAKIPLPPRDEVSTATAPLAAAPASAALARAPAPPSPVQAQPPARGARPAVQVDPGAPMLGVMFVAAMLVLGTGGWLLTRGGFVRPAHPEVAAREAAEALKKAKAKAAATPAPLASLPEAAPVAPEPAAAPAEPPAPPAEAVPAAAVEPPLEAAPTEPVPVAPVAPAVREPVRPAAGAAEPRVRQAAPGWRPPEPAPAPAPATDAPQLTITPQPTTAPALSVRPAAAAPAPAPTGAMPDTPTREDVARAMDSVRSRVTACAAGKHGVAEVDLTVLGTGDVSHVVVTGDFSGTAEGSCIAREARTARFSPFVKPRFRLIYPFQL